MLQALHVGAGFRWADIARNLGVSDRTLMRRRREYQMFDTDHDSNFAVMTNRELDHLIRGNLHITPGIGYRLIQGALRQPDFACKDGRVLELMQRVDPITATLRASRTIIRRQYSLCIMVNYVSIIFCFH